MEYESSVKEATLSSNIDSNMDESGVVASSGGVGGENEEETGDTGQLTASGGSIWDDDEMFKPSQSYEELIKNLKLISTTKEESMTTPTISSKFDRLLKDKLTFTSIVRALRLRDDLVKGLSHFEVKKDEEAVRDDDEKLRDYLFNRSLTKLRPLNYDGVVVSETSEKGVGLIAATGDMGMFQKCIDILHSEKLIIKC